MSIPYPFNLPETDPNSDTDAAPQLVDAWRLAEQTLLAPDVNSRLTALDSLLASPTYRYSPVTCLVLFTLLRDDTPVIFQRVVPALAEVFARNSDGWLAPANARQYSAELLRMLAPESVVTLMALAADQPELSHAVSTVLDRVPGLTEIVTGLLAERDSPLEVRLAALQVLQTLGRTDALPTLEQIERRLLAVRINQLGFAFMAAQHEADIAFMNALQATITYLREDE